MQREKDGKIKKGNVPHNKGIFGEKRLKSVEKFQLGMPIECKTHGEHSKWRLHSGNNVQCVLCSSDSQRSQRKRNPLKFIFYDAKKHAKSSNRIFEISLEFLQRLNEIQESRCALTGIEFSQEFLPSLDRKNSKVGYTEGNVQLVLIKINIMKSNFCEEEFIELCEKITEYSVARKAKSRKK